MNAHKTFSLLAAVAIVAGQATLFAVDTHASAQSATSDTNENRYEAKSAPARAVYATALALRAAGTQGA